MFDEMVIVSTTGDDQQVLEQIAETLVLEQLAACVQIGPAITSHYRWQGNTERSTEWTCSIKTTPDLLSKVWNRVAEYTTMTCRS